MGKVLTILEVSRKQDYIFASKKLRENAERSQDIAYLTSETRGDECSFFAKAAGDAYQESGNLVNSGGGHAVFQFGSRDDAVEFTRRVTLAALLEYPELELFAATVDYNPDEKPQKNMDRLNQALEEKKSRRASSFRQLQFGVEAFRDPDSKPRPDAKKHKKDLIEPPKGFKFLSDPDKELVENFIAVIHIDGNNMGARIGSLYERYAEKTGPENWDACRKELQKFSKNIQAHFEGAFQQMVDVLARQPGLDEICTPPQNGTSIKTLPVRPIILAGDDVCFVTAGSIGLECARVFMEALSHTENPAGGKAYAACAGVAMVHVKYPFHRAYQLAEQLCDSAKKYSAELDPEQPGQDKLEQRRVSAMDWHIEFGQLKDSLSELREDYITEDSPQTKVEKEETQSGQKPSIRRLELRPVTVIIPQEVDSTKFPPERDYSFFRKMCSSMRGEYGQIARSKIKEFRTALKQGDVEGRFFLSNKQIGDLLYEPLKAAYSQKEWAEKVRDKAAFQTFQIEDGFESRCLFFDAIEMIDHFTPFKEVDS